ncbi:MAG: hypothetical protein ONB11_06655 [candidate division KSB1 bacterium]|nr:hypothetical protein [candidate division KSB1 bacterium]
MDDLIQSLPTEISGWQSTGADEFYNRETLHEYINGGAELYLAYAFQQMVARRYVKQNAPEIVLEIYNMTHSSDAYGIFSSERQDEEAGIGQDSEYGGGLLRFWKDKYFISILAIGDETVAKPIIFELGQKVAAAIPVLGERPDILRLIPDDHLLKNRIRFFHAHTILNRQYFLASENILNLDQNTDCVFAPFEIRPAKSYALIIRYADKQQAETAYLSFLANYLPDALVTGFARLENGSWTMARPMDHFLIIVLEAPSQEWASDLIAKVMKRIR